MGLFVSTNMTAKEILAAIVSGKIQVRSVADCAESEFHLCSDKATGLKGEQQAACSECAGPLFFTQNFPPEGPQPRKICLQCALSLARGECSLSA